MAIESLKKKGNIVNKTSLLCNNQVMAGVGARVTGSCMLFPDALY